MFSGEFIVVTTAFIACISFLSVIVILVSLLIVVQERAMAATLVPARSRCRNTQSSNNRTTARRNQEAA
ncbi:MAG: hypothetical protein JXB07_15175 [Anaerolineae bacterium]|nr:hypothetical protein [Anaerolineae bacterium]